MAGKPARPLLDETMRRVGGERPLMVGDRLDTDIEGGPTAGVDSLLVLTGVTGLAELVAARPEERPTYLSRGPRRAGRGAPGGPVVGAAAVTAAAAGPRAVAGRPRWRSTGDGAVDDWWRVVAAAAGSTSTTPASRRGRRRRRRRGSVRP